MQENITVDMIVATLSMYDRHVADIENRYATTLPMEVKLLLTEYEGRFIQVAAGEHYRVVDRDEIKDPLRHLGLDCIQMRLVPLVDCKDNNYLAYNLTRNTYDMVNIVDGLPFDSWMSLVDFWRRL